MFKCLIHKTKIFIILAVTFFPLSLQAQFFLYSDKPLDIKTKFLRHSLEAKAKDAIFNILTIKNNSNQGAELTLSITVPEGWSVIGSEKIELQINPLDSIYVPLRIAVGSQVRGDIGYSIIASLADSRGNTLINEYCYVKIPRVTDLNVRILDRIAYLDPFSGTSKFSMHIVNKGNRDEPINFIVDGKNFLEIGNEKQLISSRDILVKSYQDTTVTFEITLTKDEVFKKNTYGLEVLTTTIDTTYKGLVWFQRLDSKLNNYISPVEKPLVITLIGMGLLDANRVPTLSSILEGKIFLKKENELYYYYRNFSSKSYEDLYTNSRIQLGYNHKKWKFEFGDNLRVFDTRAYGRGGYIVYQGEKLVTDIIFNQEKNSKINNYGTFVRYNLNKDLYLNTGASYSNNTNSDFQSKAAIIGFGTKLSKHVISASFIYNIITKNIDGENEHNEFGGELSYKSKVNKFDNSVTAFYNSPLFYGPQPGYLRIYGRSMYTINSKNKIIMFYQENQNTKPLIRNTQTLRTQINIRRAPRIEYHYSFNSNVRVYGGPGLENIDYSGLSIMPAGKHFETLGFKVNLGARFKDTYGEFMISPVAEFGRVYVTSNPVDTLNPSNKNISFNYQYFSVNFLSKYFNILAFYNSGPRSPMDQLNYTMFSKSFRKIHVIPSIDRFIYKDIIRTIAGISYSSNIASGSMYTNLTGQLYWYLPKNWTINGLLVYTIQTKTNAQDIVEKYQNYYFEFGIKKEFDINQPRVKYYDVNLNFFKDFNGNFIKESNEQGIKNVLVRISKLRSDVQGYIPSDLFAAELISDNFGKVVIENMPEGIYKIDYNPIGADAGTYSKALEEIEIRINKSGDYFFPFVEKNKVFGKIVLNRSRLSGLGRLDLSNIRITATDSQGRSYTTLTDKNGEFVLFAPITDDYIVTINNIFYENFDLRQNNFLVQFNGYKQFEVNFVFDEKVRRINFATTPETEGVTGVQQVRRTNISGTIKDANSQKPIRARINLINTRTNVVVTSSFSNATSGEYTLTFMASENYLLEVLADDYWYLSENIVLNQVTTFMNITRDVLLRPISVGSKVELNIKFESNNDFLAPESVAELNRLLRILKQNPSVRIEVQGHCDDLEALQRPEIALDRAKAVAKYLIENGYSNVEVKSLGNTVPIAANDTEEGRTRNRRVEVEVLSK